MEKIIFPVLYRFYLQPHQEELYKECWDKLTGYFIKERGAIGSCLHKTDNGLWIAYSRWPGMSAYTYLMVLAQQ